MHGCEDPHRQNGRLLKRNYWGAPDSPRQKMARSARIYIQKIILTRKKVLDKTVMIVTWPSLSEATRSRSSWPCVGETVRAHKYVSLPLPGATGANGRRQSHTHPPGGKKWHSSGPTDPIFFDILICQGYKDPGLRNIFTVLILRIGLWLLVFIIYFSWFTVRGGTWPAAAWSHRQLYLHHV